MSRTGTRHKDFGRSLRVDEYSDVSFDLNGETFSCRPAIPGAKMLDFVKQADGENGAAAAEALLSFLREVLLEEDWDRFEEMVNDSEVIVEVETLGEITGWLVEQYAERPTKERSRSASGRSTAGRTSKDISPDEE